LRYHLPNRTLQLRGVESRLNFPFDVEWKAVRFFVEDGYGEIAVCGDAFNDAHFEPAEHDRN
jgi:hypothetical protein